MSFDFYQSLLANETFKVWQVGYMTELGKQKNGFKHFSTEKSGTLKFSLFLYDLITNKSRKLLTRKLENLPTRKLEVAEWNLIMENIPCSLSLSLSLSVSVGVPFFLVHVLGHTISVSLKFL